MLKKGTISVFLDLALMMLLNVYDEILGGVVFSWMVMYKIVVSHSHFNLRRLKEIHFLISLF